MVLPGYWRSPLDPERVMQAGVTHWQEQEQHSREDALSIEEPFEVRIDHRSLAVIMRTPGNDHELAMGFLYTEKVIAQPEDVLSIEEEGDPDGLPLANVVNVALRHHELPYSRHILMVSGRTSFEIIQKALLARIPCIAAISAPSSLAVELADSAGITLIGFLRDHSMNVYTHAERVI